MNFLSVDRGPQGFVAVTGAGIPAGAWWLAMAVLSVWRITHLLWGEDGPGRVLVGLRRLAGDGFFGSLMDCFYCLSLWVAAPFAYGLGGSWGERGLLWTALSGGAILLERATASQPAPPPAARWHEEPLPASDHGEENERHAMLW